MNTQSNTYIHTSYNGIPFQTEWDLGTIPSELGGYIEEAKKFTLFVNINFLELSGQFIAVEFSDIKAADEYQSVLQKRFTQKSKSWNSEPNSDGTQNLKYAGRGEYNGRYYILAQTCNRLDDSYMNEKKGIWKGVVLNPFLYFSDNVQVQADIGSGKIGRILDT